MNIQLVPLRDPYAGWKFTRASVFLPRPIMRLRDWILSIEPIFGVPREMSLILFYLVNLYKCTFILTNPHINLKFAIVGTIFFTTFIEVPPLLSIAVFYTGIVVCYMLAIIPFVISPGIFILALCACYSQPLSFCMDIIYLMRSLAYCTGTGSDEFFMQTMIYAFISFFIASILDWEMGIFDPSTETLILLLLHFLASLCYLFAYDVDYLFTLRVEWTRYVLFQLVINATIKHFYKGETLTYSFEHIKNLYDH